MDMSKDDDTREFLFLAVDFAEAVLREAMQHITDDTPPQKLWMECGNVCNCFIGDKYSGMCQVQLPMFVHPDCGISTYSVMHCSSGKWVQADMEISIRDNDHRYNPEGKHWKFRGTRNASGKIDVQPVRQ
jgi:hypothetical protein